MRKKLKAEYKHDISLKKSYAAYLSVFWQSAMFVRRGLSRTCRCGSHGGWRWSLKSTGWHRFGLKIVQNRDLTRSRTLKSGSWCGENSPQSRKGQRDDFFSECCGSSSAPRFYPRSWGCTRAARVGLSGCHPSNRHAGQRTGVRGLSWARPRLVTCLDAEDDFTHSKTPYFMFHTNGICLSYIYIVFIEL